MKPRSRDEYVSWLSSMSQPTPDWMITTVRANNEDVTDPSTNYMPEGAESACVCQPAPESSLPSISVEEVHALPPSDERLLLDVRQPDEYVSDLGHVPNARLIPLGELPSRLAEIEMYRDKTVIAIRRSGARSAKAAEILMGDGFRNVLNMAGGTHAWAEKGYDVER